MIWLWICTHFWLFHLRCFVINMTPMWHHCIFICFIYAIWFFTRPSVLRILALIFEFLKIPITSWFKLGMYTFCIYKTFTTTQNLVSCGIYFIWGGNSELNVEPLIMILFSESIASLSLQFTGSIKRPLWSYLMYAYSNNFGTICGLVWQSLFTFRQTLKIDDWKNL